MVARNDRTPRRRLDPDSRKAAIVAAAVRAFGARPYPGVSVASVAAAAGASEALVHKYFEGKPGLYAAALSEQLDALASARRAAVSALGDEASARDRVRVMLLVQLDAVAAGSGPWLGSSTDRVEEPAAAIGVRQAARGALVEELRTLLPDSTGWPRHEYALWGFLGFLDGAVAAWAARSCPQDERWLVVEAALGALEGARGDWAG